MRSKTKTQGLSSLETRAVRFEEVAEVLRVIRRAVEHGCRGHYDRLQREAVFRAYARTLFVEVLGPCETVTALHEGRVVAIAQLDPASTRLRALFVDSSIQQSGVGRALLDEVEERAMRRGCTRLHGAMSLNAIAFYSKAGYRPSGPQDQLIAGGVSVPVLRMEKDLGRPTGAPRARHAVK